MHNVLQGVSRPDQRISPDERKTITDWITDNATRYWLSKGGPLRPPEEGGADVIVVSELSSSLFWIRRASYLGPLLSEYEN